MFLQNEKYINKGLAVTSVILIVVSICVVFIAGGALFLSVDYNILMQNFNHNEMFGMHDGMSGMFQGWKILEYIDANQLIGSFALFIIGGILLLLSQIFQIIVVYQWSRALNTNIDNTRYTFHQLKTKIEDKSKTEALNVMDMGLSNNKVQVWAYWIYFAMIIISYFSIGSLSWISLIGVIFLAIYINSVFSVAKYLQDSKNRVYEYLNKRIYFTKSIIKDRNVGLFILFVIITFGIYWLYLIIKLSDEINNYLSWDIQTREKILENSDIQ
jgi:hypothetical protein